MGYVKINVMVYAVVTVNVAFKENVKINAMAFAVPPTSAVLMMSASPNATACVAQTDNAVVIMNARINVAVNAVRPMNAAIMIHALRTNPNARPIVYVVIAPVAMRMPAVPMVHALMKETTAHRARFAVVGIAVSPVVCAKLMMMFAVRLISCSITILLADTRMFLVPCMYTKGVQLPSRRSRIHAKTPSPTISPY